MNCKLYACALFLALGLATRADVLNQQHVAADAKWLIHIDCDNLRQTQVGQYLFQQLLLPKVAAATGDLNLNISNLVERINSITAYGEDFQSGLKADGVLLINSDTETRKALEGLLVAQILVNTNGPIKKLSSEGEQAVYAFGNEIFISPMKEGPIILSKSQDRVDSARELLAGKGANLASTKSFGELLSVSNSFFVVAAAQAFGPTELFPAQAKVLRMADGGCVALGEKDDHVCLKISLRGKTAEVTKQIQQVIEGMVALVKLGQPDIPDVVDLANSIKVSTLDDLVTLSADYPTSKAIARLQDVTTPKPHTVKPPHHKAKAKGKPQVKPATPAEKPEAEEDETPSK